MIIRINAMGKVTLVSGTALTQGSSLSNEIFFEAPISGAASCNVYFTLPNGAHIGPYYADSCDADASLGINTWHLIIDAAITQYAGELCVHADFMQGEKVLATADCYTTIRRGAYRPSLVLPDNAEQYLEAFSKAYADGANAFLNLLAAIGAESVRVWYAWKDARGGSSVRYTKSRNPSVGDSFYKFDKWSGEFSSYSATLNITSVSGDVASYTYNGVSYPYRYTEELNGIEVVKNGEAPEGTLLMRLNEITANAVRNSDIANYDSIPGIVYGGTYQGVTIENGRVGLDAATAEEIIMLRYPFEGPLIAALRKDKPITLGIIGEAVHSAPVPTKEQHDTARFSQHYEYYLGVKDRIDVSLPIQAALGDRVYIQWVSAYNPTTLSIDSSNTNDLDFTPLAFHVCEIQGVYGIIGYDAAKLKVLYGWNLAARQAPAEVGV